MTTPSDDPVNAAPLFSTWWDDAKSDYLPWRTDTLEIGCAEGVYQGSGGRCVRLRLYEYGVQDGRHIVVDIREQEIPLYLADGLTETHVRAFLEGTDLAFAELVARFDGADPPMASSFFCPPLLLERHESAARVRERLLEPKGPLHAWRRICGPLEADDETFAAFCEERGLPRKEILEALRDAALISVHESPIVGRMREVYGLALPESTLVARAFFEALSPLESDAYRELRLPNPVNVLEWNLDGAPQPATEGLPGSLAWRFASDPAELVTLFTSDGDGSHFGLFYEDANHPPCGLAHSYARDAADTSWVAPTALDVVRTTLEELAAEGDADRFGGVDRAGCLVRLVRAALDRFEPANARARSREQAAALVSYEHRIRMARQFNGIAPVGPGGAVDERPPIDSRSGGASMANERRAELLEEATVALDAGDALHALTVLRALHFDAGDTYEACILLLLERAYRSLGRPELATIAATHAAYRWRSSVVTYSAGSR